jgi:hypothetical protein
MADIPEPVFVKSWRQALSTLISESHATSNKYPEAASAVQEVHKVTNDIEVLPICTPAGVGEGSQWTTVMTSAEENRESFCKS